MFEGLLNLPRGAFLVHCSAGKDRTGVASALILHALGVSRASVMGDYMLTNQVIDYDGYVLPRLVARYEPDVLPDKELVMALAGVHETYLQSAYAAIDAQFEDVEGYLQEALGLHADARAELRARYLE
jgi:protein-tyrosine phosphatase